ncbi:MAG: hypothetical protein OHK0040_04330 [bacterium]
MALLILSSSNLFAEQRHSDANFENQTLVGENVFSGTITVKGRLTIQEGSSLTILPATKIVFLYLDEDGDGIGESEILSQGEIKVLGTKDKPVLFLSNEKRAGAWLGFSIMNVDTENIIQHAVFEDAYMALHSHFSTLKVSDCTFRNNFRGFQSQEGVITLYNNEFYKNNTGVQFRNSKSFLKGNKITENMGGLNFLYSTVSMEDNHVENNRLFGMKARFSKVDIKRLTVSKSMQNIYSKNSEITMVSVSSREALLRGFSFEGSQISISDSSSEDNLLDGISLDTSLLECDKLTFKNNGRFHIYLKGKSSFNGNYESDRKENVLFIEN